MDTEFNILETDNNTDGENIPQHSQLQQDLDITEEKKIAFEEYENFLNIISTPPEELSIAEISDEEKSILYFHPEYTPTTEEVEKRRFFIENSHLELATLEKATPQNNIILKQEESKEGKVLDLNYVRAINDFSKELSLYYKDSHEQPSIPAKEMAKLALSRCQQLGFKYKADYVLENRLSARDQKMIEESYCQVLSSEDLITLSEIPKDTWDDSIDLLKRVPYITPFNLNIKKIADNISTKNSIIKSKDIIERFEKTSIITQKRMEFDYEFYSDLSESVINGTDLVIQHQNERAIHLYTGNYSPQGPLKLELLMANFGVAYHTLAPSQKDYLLASFDTFKEDPKFFKEKIGLIRNYNMRHINTGWDETFRYIANPQNYETIKKTNRYLQLGIYGAPLWGKSIDEVSSHIIENVTWHINNSLDLKKYHLEDIEERLLSGDFSRDLENIGLYKLDRFLSNFTLNPYVEGYKSFRLSDSKKREMLNISDGTVKINEKFLEHIYTEGLYEGNKDIAQVKITARELTNPEAKTFWKFHQTNQTPVRNVLYRELANHSFDYSKFAEEYISTTGKNLYINEKFHNLLLKDLVNLEEYENILLDNKSIERFTDSGAKLFWTTMLKFEPTERISYIKTFALDNENIPDINHFIQKYTTTHTTDGITKQIPNSLFAFQLMEVSNGINHINEELLTKEVLSTYSEFDKLYFEIFLDLPDLNNRRGFYEMYTNGDIKDINNLFLYKNLLFEINNSPSPEILRLKNQILTSVITQEGSTEDKLLIFKELRDTFERNNSPTPILRWKIFNQLYLPRLAGTITEGAIPKSFSDINSNREYSVEQKTDLIAGIIKKDLLRISKESVDINLYNFLENLKEGSDALEYYDNYNQEGFSDEEIIQQLGDSEKEYLMKTVDLFFTASDKVSYNNNSLPERIKELREFLNIRPNEQLTKGLYDKYIIDLSSSELTGNIYNDIESIQEDMVNIQKAAHERGLKYAEEGLVTIDEGDFLKGVRSLDGIIDDGIYAKDFLGADASQDSTPYDTDTIRVVNSIEGQTFSEALSEKGGVASNTYELVLIMKDRGQYSQEGKYELIHSRVMGQNHYGIRTGIANTDIDFICLRQGDLNKLKFDIASKGIYIPVVNREGEMIFTPTEFEKQRETFAGLSGILGKDFVINEKTDISSRALRKIQEKQSAERDETEQVSRMIQVAMRGAIERSGIGNAEELFESSRSGLGGIRIEETGSTARFTNVLGASDYDYSILIPPNILNKLDMQQINNLINGTMVSIGTPVNTGGIYGTEESIQLVGSEILINTKNGRKEIEFDLGITNKGTNLDGSNSHEYIMDRLNHIKEQQGEETYNFVISNIVLAKIFLKENKCYKKGNHGQGGLGGIGVENWILQHHGNFEEAVDKFLEATGALTGEAIPFEKFKESYSVYDPGRDIRMQKHDNFVDNMNPSGYTKMVEAFMKLKRGEIGIPKF